MAAANHVAKLEMRGLAGRHDQHARVGRIDMALVELENVLGRMPGESIAVAAPSGFLIPAPIVVGIRANRVPVVKDFVAELTQRQPETRELPVA